MRKTTNAIGRALGSWIMVSPVSVQAETPSRSASSHGMSPNRKAMLRPQRREAKPASGPVLPPSCPPLLVPDDGAGTRLRPAEPSHTPGRPTTAPSLGIAARHPPGWPVRDQRSARCRPTTAERRFILFGSCPATVMHQEVTGNVHMREVPPSALPTTEDPVRTTEP